MQFPKILCETPTVKPGSRLVYISPHGGIRSATAGPTIHWEDTHYCITSSHIFNETFYNLPESDNMLEHAKALSPFPTANYTLEILDIDELAEQCDLTLSDLDSYHVIGELAFSGLDQSLDFALIKLESVKYPLNRVYVDGCKRVYYQVTRVNGDPVGQVEVYVAASSGTRRGKLVPGSARVLLPTGGKFQPVYDALLDAPVQNGDCGACVFGKEGGFYGLVLSAGAEGNSAFVLPATCMLDDLKRFREEEPSL
ncbi:hypothetical protein BDV25DRAFT_138497 [Aspergillus avenaceus]|uniref:Trypsin-like cysteine/serine peptidase domain-containing protein n=1 Tax=Aspergillus avenaceus TaxID=36643 RepID=A0A5N6TZJ7_ASPAV|nr:hypothetical protein BDV25DRAFT_138497 [Aspergillus avenaceus]